MQESLLGIGSRVRHPEFGVGVVIQVKSTSYLITFVNHGTKGILHSYQELEVLEAQEAIDDLVSLADIEKTLRRIVADIADSQEPVPLADKWLGGKLIFQPAQADKKPYEMPIDVFFHKIVMVRDRLRVMEQRVNSSQLSDEEKIGLQQYITRIYGSLTSFNVLFKQREDGFMGSGSKS